MFQVNLKAKLTGRAGLAGQVTPRNVRRSEEEGGPEEGKSARLQDTERDSIVQYNPYHFILVLQFTFRHYIYSEAILQLFKLFRN